MHFVFAENNKYIIIIFLLINSLSFYLANYTAFYTGVLSTSHGGFGVTELQFIVMFLGLTSVFLGKEFW